jgi:RNA polymerase sigma-70 factor, ECF subfamily
MKGSVDSVERRLIARLKQRDERAFNELVEAYGQQVFRLVLRMLGNPQESEDVVQDVFVQVFKGIDRFRGDSQLGTWIYRVAVNTCKNHLQYLTRRKVESQHDLEPVVERSLLDRARGVTSSEQAGPEQVLMGHQAESIVKRCLLELEEEFRELLILRDLEDLSYEAIIEITGLAEGTVKSRLHRGRALLREKVAQALGLQRGDLES